MKTKKNISGSIPKYKKSMKKSLKLGQETIKQIGGANQEEKNILMDSATKKIDKLRETVKIESDIHEKLWFGNKKDVMDTLEGDTKNQLINEYFVYQRENNEREVIQDQFTFIYKPRTGRIPKKFLIKKEEYLYTVEIKKKNQDTDEVELDRDLVISAAQLARILSDDLKPSEKIIENFLITKQTKTDTLGAKVVGVLSINKVFITQIMPDSLAAQAGMKPYRLIKKINETDITLKDQAIRIITENKRLTFTCQYDNTIEEVYKKSPGMVNQINYDISDFSAGDLDIGIELTSKDNVGIVISKVYTKGFYKGFHKNQILLKINDEYVLNKDKEYAVKKIQNLKSVKRPFSLTVTRTTYDEYIKD